MFIQFKIWVYLNEIHCVECTIRTNQSNYFFQQRMGMSYNGHQEKGTWGSIYTENKNKHAHKLNNNSYFLLKKFCFCSSYYFKEEYFYMISCPISRRVSLHIFVQTFLRFCDNLIYIYRSLTFGVNQTQTYNWMERKNIICLVLLYYNAWDEEGGSNEEVCSFLHWSWPYQC